MEKIELELAEALAVPAPARRWQTYGEYKDAGVQWLGMVPAHWTVQRLRFVCDINPAKSETVYLPSETLVSFLPMENIGETGKMVLAEVRPLDQVRQGYTYFRNGDVVVAKITPCFENGKGGLCQNLLNGIGFGTTELHVLRAKKPLLPHYLTSLISSHPFRSLGEASMSGAAGQQRVTGSFVQDFRVALPSLAEQRAIAAFLDRETAHIDALLAKKEQLIALLQEKRAALISQAVTRGLNPAARMKDSGVEWLGMIPAHWLLLPLRRVIALFVDYRGMTPIKVPAGIPLITARNIKGGTLDFSESQEFISAEDYSKRMVRGKPARGDVLITTEAPLGETAQIVDEKIALAQRIILLKAKQEVITNEYLRYSFLSLSGQGELWSRATGSTAIGIKASHLKEILCVVPPLVEQQAIVAFLEREIPKIDVLIARIREAMRNVKEYRIALISAAVTGKIDVRGEMVDLFQPICS